MGTIRIVLIAKSKRKIASGISFFEMFIWLMAISNIMRNLDNMVCCLAYAVGYSAGVYLGMAIEEKISRIDFSKTVMSKSLFSKLIFLLPVKRQSMS